MSETMKYYITNSQLTNGSFSLANLAELYYTASLGPGTFKEDLGQLDLTGSFKQFNQILVGSRPRQLTFHISNVPHLNKAGTYIANHDLLTRLRLISSAISTGAATSSVASSSISAYTRTCLIRA